MKWKSLALLFVVLVVIALQPPVANATSAYDDYYNTTDSVILTQNGCDPVDISYSWEDYLDTYISSFEEAVANGSWGVSYLPNYSVSNGQKIAIVYWDEDHEMDVTWHYWGYMQASSSTSTVALQLYYDEAGCYVDVWNYGAPYISSNDGNVKNYFFNGDPTYPSGYEGATVASEPPPAKYVAMGDSFSSGEGVPSFEYGTDVNGVNGCHRSPQAYPRLLQNDSSLNLGPTAFVACSGATTATVKGGQYNEPSQTDALSADTEVVTITVGGNDVLFKDYVVSCITVLCGYGTTPYNDIMDRISDPDFEDDLEDVYTTILDDAENADVYVLDYPYLADPYGVDGFACVTPADLSGAVPVQAALNAAIADAVDDVQAVSMDYSNRLTYMPTNYIDGPFIGHHLCTDDPDGTSFNGIVGSPVNTEYSFHPNAQGQHDYYEVMEDYLD